ncbi:hypothetical protein GOP47_0027655 [Adiantum capillus-veneris]|nr:hypothetical protein GOP47_0027655 [Adiantum capillus-veneris]
MVVVRATHRLVRNVGMLSSMALRSRYHVMTKSLPLGYPPELLVFQEEAIYSKEGPNVEMAEKSFHEVGEKDLDVVVNETEKLIQQKTSANVQESLIDVTLQSFVSSKK